MEERAEMLKSNLPGVVKSCKYQKVPPLSPISKILYLGATLPPHPSLPPLLLLPSFVFAYICSVSDVFVITFVVIILLNNKIYCHLSCLHGCSHAWSSCALSSASFLLEKIVFTPPEIPSAQSPPPWWWPSSLTMQWLCPLPTSFYASFFTTASSISSLSS